MKHIKSISVFILFLLTIPKISFAGASVEKPFEFNTQLITSIVLLVSVIFILLVMIYILHVLDLVRRGLKGEDITADKPIFAFIESWKNSMTDAVPIEKETEIEFDHEYDGIRELDNNLPPWWVYLFYITIIFAVIYLGHYHIFKTGDLQATEYKKSMIQAEKDKEAYMKLAANNIDENSVKVVTEKKGIENGKTIFLQSCSPCHGKLGEGGVGPNLTDKYWLHGGNIKNIFKTIKYGVPQKGMISWKAQLNPGQIQDISSYILTLQGTNPPNGKAPQGDLFEETAEVKK